MSSTSLRPSRIVIIGMNWGYKFRFGHFEITTTDFLLIAQTMLPNNAQTVLTPVKSMSVGQNLDLFTDQPELQRCVVVNGS